MHAMKGAAFLASAIVLLLPTIASADSASISVADAGGGKMQATVSVTSTSCLERIGIGGSPIKTCTWTAEATIRHASLPCLEDQVLPVFLLGFSQEASTLTKTVTFSPFFPREAKLCVFLNNNAGDRTIAETVFPVPAGYGVQRGNFYNCSSFSNQAQAQYYYELYPGDPSRLDADHDGRACEDNPCPCGAEAIPAEPLPEPPPALTAGTKCTSTQALQERLRGVIERATRKLHLPGGPLYKSHWRRHLRSASKELHAAKRKQSSCA